MTVREMALKKAREFIRISSIGPCVHDGDRVMCPECLASVMLDLVADSIERDAQVAFYRRTARELRGEGK